MQMNINSSLSLMMFDMFGTQNWQKQRLHFHIPLNASIFFQFYQCVEWFRKSVLRSVQEGIRNIHSCFFSSSHELLKIVKGTDVIFVGWPENLLFVHHGVIWFLWGRGQLCYIFENFRSFGRTTIIYSRYSFRPVGYKQARENSLLAV